MSPGTLVVGLAGWGIWPGSMPMGEVMRRVQRTRRGEVGIVLATVTWDGWDAALVAWRGGLVGWTERVGLGVAPAWVKGDHR